MTGADLRFYLYLFLRRLPLMIIVGALVAGVGLGITLTLPPVYQATSTIRVESPLISAPAISVESVGAPARLQVIHQELMTHASLLALAERHGLNRGATVLSPESIVADLRGRIQFNPVSFGGNQDALGFSISFEAETAELAADVANDLVSMILKRDLADRSARTTATLSFFEEEVARLTRDVAGVEARLLAYKTQHLQALPDTLEFRRLLQINTRDRLLVLAREESSLRSRRASYVEFHGAAGNLEDGAARTPEQHQLLELRLAFQSQRLMFAPESPVLAILEAQIAQAENRLVSDAGAGTAADAAVPILDAQLAEMEDRLGAIAVERASLERADVELTASIAATPANEAALNALEREYLNIQGLYNAAVARLAEASTGEQIATRSQGERLMLVERALPPEKPVGPRRMRMALTSLALGVAAGLLAAVAFELLTWRVRRPIEVERKLGIEVIAAIPYIPKRSLFSLPRLGIPGHRAGGTVPT